MLFSWFEIIFILHTINNGYERYTSPIIIHATTDAALDNLLMRFNFICDTTFLHPTSHRCTANLKNDFHISLDLFLMNISIARCALHYWIET